MPLRRFTYTRLMAATIFLLANLTILKLFTTEILYYGEKNLLLGISTLAIIVVLYVYHDKAIVSGRTMEIYSFIFGFTVIGCYFFMFFSHFMADKIVYRQYTGGKLYVIHKKEISYSQTYKLTSYSLLGTKFTVPTSVPYLRQEDMERLK